MLQKEKLQEFVELCIKLVAQGVDLGNAPFGALLVDPSGKVVMTAFNTQRSDNDPTAHAEINLLRKAGKAFGTIYFPEYKIVGNAEACSMCMSAAIKAKITEFYFGAYAEASMDPELPASLVASKAKNPILLEGGILEERCTLQIKEAREKQRDKVR